MKTTPRRHTLGIVLALLALPAATMGGLALAPRFLRRAAVETTDPSSAAQGSRPTWPKGREARYELVWEGDTQVDVTPGAGASPVEGSYRLAGELVVRGLGDTEGGTLVALSFASLETHSLRAMGAELLPDDTAARALLVGREAWLVVDASGTVKATWLTASDPGPFKDVVRAIAAHLSLSVPASAEEDWTASELTELGRAETHYRRSGARGETLARTHVRYDQLFAVPADGCGGCVPEIVSRGEVELGEDGAVLRIDEGERVLLGKAAGAPMVRARSVFQLVRRDVVDVSIAAHIVFDPATLERRTLAERSDDKPSAQVMLARRIGGLTERDLVAGIDLYAESGKLPEIPGFLTKASGLLLADPTLCGALAARFARPESTTRARALSLDLLASAGSKEAQAAMREALQSPAARKEAAAYPLLFQRLSLLARPDAETGRFVANAYAHAAQGDRTVRDATAYALGAVAGRLVRAGSEGEARALAAGLRNDLARADDPRDRAALIGALGGAHLPEVVATLASFAHDDAPAIRDATARALGDARTPEARAALLPLATDPDADVQLTAWKSLQGQDLRAEDIHALREAVTGGKTSVSNDARLVGLLAEHGDRPEDVRAMLGYMLTRTTDLRLAGRIRFVLAQLGGAG